MRHPLRGVTLALLAALVLPSVALAAKKNADVTIVNKSDWGIQHFFLSANDEDAWGPDQLGDEVIGTGESFLLHGIPCDSYDVKLIDEDGDECEVFEVDVCGGSEQWTITNKILLACEEGT